MGEQPVQALDLKCHLQHLCGHPRFRQRLLLSDGQILQDDEVLHGPLDIQLILLPFIPSSKEQIQELRAAAGQGDLRTLKRLLQRPQDPDLALATFACGPLYVASLRGNVPVVRLLLEAKADKDKTQINGRSALYVASSRGNVEVVRLLLEAKADKEKASRTGTTPMQVASKREYLSC